MMKARNFSLVLGVVLVLLAGSVASAATFNKQKADDGTFTLPSGGDILWGQLDDPGLYANTVQAFEANYAGYNSEGADDFDVTDAAGWDVTTINTPGSAQNLGESPFFISNAFYEDAGGLPGALICDQPANLNFTDDGDGSYSVTVECNIPSGVAWMAEFPRADLAVQGQFFWGARASTNLSEGVWRNPGGAWGSPNLLGTGDACNDWAPMNAVCLFSGVDWLFELLGSVRQGGGVPAVGPFGVVLMVLALGGGSAYVMRRRRA